MSQQLDPTVSAFLDDSDPPVRGFLHRPSASPKDAIGGDAFVLTHAPGTFETLPHPSDNACSIWLNSAETTSEFSLHVTRSNDFCIGSANRLIRASFF